MWFAYRDVPAWTCRHWLFKQPSSGAHRKPGHTLFLLPVHCRMLSATPKPPLKIHHLCSGVWGQQQEKAEVSQLAMVTHSQLCGKALGSPCSKFTEWGWVLIRRYLKMLKCSLSSAKIQAFPAFSAHQLLRLSKVMTLLQTGRMTRDGTTLVLLPEGQKS